MMERRVASIEKARGDRRYDHARDEGYEPYRCGTMRRQDGIYSRIVMSAFRRNTELRRRAFGTSQQSIYLSMKAGTLANIGICAITTTTKISTCSLIRLFETLFPCLVPLSCR
jgi:hypothetical protein